MCRGAVRIEPGDDLPFFSSFLPVAMVFQHLRQGSVRGEVSWIIGHHFPKRRFRLLLVSFAE